MYVLQVETSLNRKMKVCRLLPSEYILVMHCFNTDYTPSTMQNYSREWQ